MIGRNSLHLLCACERLCLPHRSITTSAVLAGRKNKLRADPRYKPIKFYNPPHPFDERFYISSKEVSRHKEHGSKWAEKYVEERCELNVFDAKLYVNQLSPTPGMPLSVKLWRRMFNRRLDQQVNAQSAADKHRRC